MELEDEPEKLIPFFSQGVIDQVRDAFVLDRDRAAVGLIEQTEDVEECAFAAAGRADDCMHGAALQLERHSPQGVHAGILFAEKTFDAFAAERNFGVHEF